MRLWVTGYYQGEYLYTQLNKGLILIYKDYSVAKNFKVTAKKQTLLKNEVIKRVKIPYIKNRKLILDKNSKRWFPTFI